MRRLAAVVSMVCAATLSSAATFPFGGTTGPYPPVNGVTLTLSSSGDGCPGFGRCGKLHAPQTGLGVFGDEESAFNDGEAITFSFSGNIKLTAVTLYTARSVGSEQVNILNAAGHTLASIEVGDYENDPLPRIPLNITGDLFRFVTVSTPPTSQLRIFSLEAEAAPLPLSASLGFLLIGAGVLGLAAHRKRALNS